MKRRQFAVATFGETGEVRVVDRGDGVSQSYAVVGHRLTVVAAENRDQAEARGRADFFGNHPAGTIQSCLIEEVPEQ